jgi:hypothetical protein
MADASDVRIGENSAEQITYRLLLAIAAAENKTVWMGPSSAKNPAVDRKWLLDTYAECLDAVRGHRKYKRPEDKL